MGTNEPGGTRPPRAARRFLSVALPALVGVVSGIGGAAWFVARSSAAAPQPAAAVAAAIESRPASPVAYSSVIDRARVAQLEARLGELEARPAPSADQPQEDPRLDFAKRKELAEAEARAIHERMYARFEQEGQDVAWSGPSRAAFDEDLKSVAREGKFNVTDLSCRTTLCVATLEWPSREDAEQGFSSVLSGSYRLARCSKEIFLDPQRRLEKPYTARAIFDCERERVAQD